MSFIEAVIRAGLRLTEFLPISSSAHVRVVGELMDPGQDPGAAFTAIIRVGTENGGADRLLERHQPHHRQVVPALAGKVLRTRTRTCAWVAGDPRLHPDRSAGTAVRGADRRQPAELLHHLGDADPLRPAAGARRPDRPAAQGAHPAHRARRHHLRARPGAGPDPRGLPLRRHHHRRSPDGEREAAARAARRRSRSVRLRSVQGGPGGAGAADGRWPGRRRRRGSPP